MCSGSEAGSYLRLVDFVYHSTLGLRVIKGNKRVCPGWEVTEKDSLSARRRCDQSTVGGLCSLPNESGKASQA